LRRVGGRWQIYLNCVDGPTRRCGTLARLLGHYVLHAARADAFAVGGFMLRQDTPTATEEWEAGEFAAELLMPRTIIERRLHRRPTAADILSLALWCGVSQRTMVQRLRTLGYAVSPWA